MHNRELTHISKNFLIPMVEHCLSKAADQSSMVVMTAGVFRFWSRGLGSYPQGQPGDDLSKFPSGFHTGKDLV